MTENSGIYRKLFFCFLLLLIINLGIYSTPAAFAVFFAVPPLLAYFAYKNGLLSASLLSVCALVFNAVAAWNLAAYSAAEVVVSTLFAVLTGLVCGVCMVKRLKVRDALFALTFAAVIFPVLYLAYLKYSLKIDIAGEIYGFVTTFFVEQFDVLKSLYPELFVSDAPVNEELSSLLGIYLPGLVPSLLIILCFTYAVIVFALSRIFCIKAMIRDSVFTQGLDCFMLPKSAGIVLIATVLLSVIGGDTVFQMGIANVTIIMMAMYMFEGISLIEYNLKQKNLNAFIRLLLLACIFFGITIVSAIIPVFNIFFVFGLLGIADSSGDFRRLSTNKDLS